MPVSKKRKKKKNNEQPTPITKNPLKTKWGKIVILLLTAGFALSGLIGLFYVLYTISQG